MVLPSRTAAAPSRNPPFGRRRRRRSTTSLMFLSRRWYKHGLLFVSFVLVVNIIRFHYSSTTNNVFFFAKDDVSSNNNNNSVVVQQDDDATVVVKNILYYTPFFNFKDFRFGHGSEPFQTKCGGSSLSGTKQCFATNNRTYLTSPGDFDAIIFHLPDFQSGGDVVAAHIMHSSWRQPHQRFVYFNLESPDTNPIMRLPPPGFYNWTMTYRYDSDIVRPYGWFTEIHGGSSSTDDRSSSSSSNQYPPPPPTDEWPILYREQDVLQQQQQQDFIASMAHLANRPNNVAWIVSNCVNTPSRRGDYVEELAKYIQVDVFGGCGTHGTCDVNYQTGRNRVDNCTLTVRNRYKFYLSFENSLCKDYVTEKFFTRVSSSVVIVMGGVDYTKIAPPHSYIDVRDYDSPRELANYLHELDRNDSLYLSYFWWKQYYTVQGSPINMQDQAFCHLCEKLHDDTEPPKSYDNIKEWWTTSGQACRRPLKQSPNVKVDW